MYSVPELCKKLMLPCPAGEIFRDVLTCREYYECGSDGQYLVKRLCPAGQKFNPARGYCMANNTFQCPAPVPCPTVAWDQRLMQKNNSRFPTELVVGGTLGSFAVLTLFILSLACIHKWRSNRQSQRSLSLRRNIQTRRMISMMENPDKLARIYEKINDRDIMGRISAFQHRRHYPHHSGSCSTFYIPRTESRFEPSIIAGSFIYHTPNNLPPHLARDFNRLSYNSFKNHHMYNQDGRGVVNSTLATPPLHL